MSALVRRTPGERGVKVSIYDRLKRLGNSAAKVGERVRTHLGRHPVVREQVDAFQDRMKDSRARMEAWLLQMESDLWEMIQEAQDQAQEDIKFVTKEPRTPSSTIEPSGLSQALTSKRLKPPGELK